MSLSNRACCVTVAALMLAVASQAGAVGQSVGSDAGTTELAQAKVAAPVVPAPAPSARQQVNRSKSNIKNNRMAPAVPVTDVPPSAGEPAEGKLKGKVTTIGDKGMLSVAAPTTDAAACTANATGGAPTACPRAITESGIK